MIAENYLRHALIVYQLKEVLTSCCMVGHGRSNDRTIDTDASCILCVVLVNHAVFVLFCLFVCFPSLVLPCCVVLLQLTGVTCYLS